VFSPGSGKDANQYLINQQIGIKTNVAEFIQKYPNTAFTIYRLSSQFDGNYYNRNDAPTRINARRPYFIWLIGNVDNIAILQEKIPARNFKGGGITDSYTLLPVAHEIDYGVQLTPKFGSFKLSREAGKTKTHILDPERESRGTHKGKFMFSLGVDFSRLQTLLGNEYLLNPDNYLLTVNRQPSDVFALEITENRGATKYTHIIQLSTKEKIPVGDVEIMLVGKTPGWIREKDDDTGLDIKASGAMDKTYGIKYMIGGVIDAYDRVVKDAKEDWQPYVRLTVNISR